MKELKPNKNYCEMLKRKIEAAIASEEDSNLKDLMERVDYDPFEMEFITLEDFRDYGYKLADFLQDEIAFMREDLLINYSQRSDRELKLAQKQFAQLKQIWVEIMDAVPKLSHISNMSESELAAYLDKLLKQDRLDSINIREDKRKQKVTLRKSRAEVESE